MCGLLGSGGMHCSPRLALPPQFPQGAATTGRHHELEGSPSVSHQRTRRGGHLQTNTTEQRSVLPLQPKAILEDASKPVTCPLSTSCTGRARPTLTTGDGRVQDSPRPAPALQEPSMPPKLLRCVCSSASTERTGITTQHLIPSSDGHLRCALVAPNLSGTNSVLSLLGRQKALALPFCSTAAFSTAAF